MYVRMKSFLDFFATSAALLPVLTTEQMAAGSAAWAAATEPASSIVDFASSSIDGLYPVPVSSSLEAELLNGRILNETLQSLAPGQTLLIRDSYHLIGGIVAHNLSNVTIQLDGQLIFTKRTRYWPRSRRKRDGRTAVMECIWFVRPADVIFTSSSRPPNGGILDGSGSAWWGYPLLGYIHHLEDRPRLIRITKGTNILMENWLLLNSPYWSTLFEAMNRLTVRYVGIQARRTSKEGHSLLDLTAFNTDGLDVTGRNVHAHDLNIWTQDDVVAVKDGPIVHHRHHKDFHPHHPTRLSENMLFERINATGLGLTIGSIGNRSEVRNITFRDCYLHKAYKGIYLKFRSSDQTAIENITFENVIMDEPIQHAIWIGPAQQADSINLCHANPCSLCWPIVPGAVCQGEENGTYRNLILRNVQINSPKQGGGVILASINNPMQNIIFDGVKVDACGSLQYEGNASDIFPLLQSKVPADAHILPFQAMVVVVGFIVAWMTARIISSWAISRSAYARLTERIASVMLWIGLLACLVTTWLVKVTLTMGKADHYFVCEGVSTGIAMGDTYPVPSCFADHTSQVAAGRCSEEPFWNDPVAGSALSAVLVSVLCATPVIFSYCYELSTGRGRWMTQDNILSSVQTDEAIQFLETSN